jgi:hypothetical protein
MASTTVFVPQGGAMAMRASERHIDRMVPERDATRRSRPLAALGFSDRVLGPYVGRAQQSPLRMFGADAPAEAESARELEIEPTSWIFPRPWYLDELDWLQSVRMSAAEAGAARPGRPVGQAAGRPARGAGAMGLGAVALTAAAAPAVALELVAPSFARAGGRADARQRAAFMGALAAAPASAGRAVAGQPAVVARPTALRAWSPLVPFPAVQAAELMAGVLAPAARAGDAGDDVPWQEAPAQELVAPFAPRELAAARQAEGTPQVSGRAATPSTRPQQGGASDVPEALRNRLQNALRRLEAQRAQTRAAARTPGQPAATPAAVRPGIGTSPSAPPVAASASPAASASAAASAGPSAGAAASASAAASAGPSAGPAASAGPSASAAASAGPAASGPAGAPVSSAGPVASGPAGAAPAAAGAAAPAVPARERALELMLHSALAGRAGQDMAPVTGPRLALPAGLGGLIAGLRAARTVARPVSSRQTVAAAAAESRPFLAPAGASGTPGTVSAVAGVQTRAAALPLVGAPGAPDVSVSGQPAGAAARAPGAGYGSAYRAVTQRRPAALGHIAWSDRWLARFAGASTQALAALEATTAAAANTPASRAFSGQAPEAVFLSTPLAERETRAGAGAATSAAAGAATSALAARAGRATVPASQTAARPAPVAQPGAAPAPQATPAGTLPGASPAAPAVAAAPRIADDASVSDDVFAAIAAAASRAPRRTSQPGRGGDAGAASAGQPRAAAAPAAAPGEPAVATPARAAEAQPAVTGPDLDQAAARPASHVDRLLAASPAAPGPGMRVALASSPVAPALSALVPLPPSPSFDVRAMHGLELASAYLAGVIEPGGTATTAARAWPMLSPLRWEQGAAAPMRIESSATEPGLWTDLPVVAPAAASAAPAASAEAARDTAAPRLAPGAAPAASVSVPSGAARVASAASAASGAANAASGAASAASGAASVAAGTAADVRQAALVQDRARAVAGPGPLLPAALPESAGPALSRGAVQGAAGRAAPRAWSREAVAAGVVATAPVALAAAAPAAGFAYGPGSAAAQAESWAMMREQHAADLSLDYVSPELLVAAQAYGFGPAEAAQAARLSSSGRTGLAALAAAVDLKFIDAFAAARSGEWPAVRASSTPSAGSPSASSPGARPTPSTGSISAPASASGAGARSISASPVAGAAVSARAASASSAASARAGDAASLAASDVAITAPGAAATVIPGAAATPAGAGAAATPAGAGASATLAGPGAAATPAASMRALGVPVRTPRGAFLWPHATIMAMNLQLAGADTAQPLSLAALDLLAANAVAQMGVLVAPEQAPAAALQQAGARSPGAVTSAGTSSAASTSTSAAVSAGLSPAAGAGQGPSSLAAALRAGLASATPLAPDVLAAVTQRDSVLAAGAPLATYVTPVLDLGFGLDAEPGAGRDAGRTAALASPAAGARAAAAGVPGSRAALTGPGAVSGPAVQEPIVDTPAAGAAAAGHRSSLPAGFEALYVALSRSPAGRSLSPAVRAARALALAGSFVSPASASRAGAGPAGPAARARAAAAWAVMPTVLTGGADAFVPGAASVDALAGASAPDMPTLAGLDMPRAEQPERQLMVARAGESLHSFVAPGEAAAPAGNRASSAPAASAPGSSAPAPRSRGAVQRVPTAAQPLVQTAQSRANVAAAQEMIRSAQQKRASGDNSIPAWFEEAARRMFQEGSDGGGISLAEMTLVTAAPARMVAASPKSASSGSSGASSRPPGATNGSESHDAEPTANVEQIARDVYAEICRMIEFARNRNGDTWR